MTVREQTGPHHDSAPADQPRAVAAPPLPPDLAAQAALLRDGLAAKKQQMRWNRKTMQPFLDVRTTVLNDTLKVAFRHRYPDFRSPNNDHVRSEAA